jgi:hypothetical protein
MPNTKKPLRRFSKNGKFNYQEIMELMMRNPVNRRTTKISTQALENGVKDLLRATEARKKEAESQPVPKQVLR